jgi:serine/threonine protein kinase
MEITDISRTYREIDGQLKFYRNTVILQKDNVFFFAHTYDQFQPQHKINIEELNIYPIPIEEIYPQFSANFTVAPHPIPQGFFVKQPDFLAYNPDAPVGRRPCDTLMEEIRICEILKDNPHPNIAQYLGCTVTDNRISGLVFTKYKVTLADRFEDKLRPLRPEIYLKGIESGLHHLHGLGLIHNDINPENIMLQEDDTPVIIDFDACQREGDMCRGAGTYPWCLDDMEFSTAENDYYGLAKIREALENGKMPDSDEPLE